MIGVDVHHGELEAAREFFDLWKTPWEFVRDGRTYEVIVSTTSRRRKQQARLLLNFLGVDGSIDSSTVLADRVHETGLVAKLGELRLPLFKRVVTYALPADPLFIEESSGRSIIKLGIIGSSVVVDIGYAIFGEVAFLLSAGQPPEYAGNATLEVHIELMRQLITRAGLPVIEIPPIPSGSEFIVCLTHDIDHPLLRNHFGDKTMLGVLYRATIGSVWAAFRRRISVGRVAKNVLTAAKLPLVYLGICRDPWSQFDRYLQIEGGTVGTYFVIPKSGDPGRKRDGSVAAMRACRYNVNELRTQLSRIINAGSEIGLHGLDAWLASPVAEQEKDYIAAVIGVVPVGIRMHWLYFDQESPAALDHAGFSYDSTFGYNQTIGFRAGTTQAYRPLGTANLFELPLTVMDTALFYPNYLNLREDEAHSRIAGLVESFRRFGGVMTINWHDRSIAPERQWGKFYAELLEFLHRRNPWFATASSAVAWFRQRRRVDWEYFEVDSASVPVRPRVSKIDSNLPGMRVRVYRPCPTIPGKPLSTAPEQGFVDTSFEETADLRLSI